MMTTPGMSLVTMSREVNTSHMTTNGTSVGGETTEEQFWFQSVYLGYLWTALIIGLPGNVLIAVVYLTVQQKRTSDWFIFFLSVYDCAVCVFAVPLYLSIETGVWMATGSDLACKIEQFTIFTAQVSSVSILGIIAVDRYLKICLPTRRSLNATQARNIGICTPLISALVAAPVLVWDGNVEHKFCRLQEHYKNTLGVKIHRCSTFGFFVCVFFVVIFCYTHVCVVVRRRIQRHRENVMKRKHLMQIPAFLQAISNVDDPTGHGSGRVHRSKRKFSLFSLGSSRRLSAITPWVKARLSLPSESVARNTGLPLDDVELESKESLAESKKKLDQALKLRGQAGLRSLNYKEKKELFKEHIEKLKDRKRAEKERNERQEVIEELSGNEDSDKQIKEDMRTLDKIFSTSEFTLANCSTHSGVIEQWRNIFSSPGKRQPPPRARQYAAETCGLSVESKLSDTGCDAIETETDSNVNIDSNCPNTCVVRVHLENLLKTSAVLAEVLDDSSSGVEVKDGNDDCEDENDAMSIVSSSDISIHIQQNKGGHQSHDEKSNVVYNKTCLPEVPAYSRRSIVSFHGTKHPAQTEKHRCQCHLISVQTQHPDTTGHSIPVPTQHLDTTGHSITVPTQHPDTTAHPIPGQAQRPDTSGHPIPVQTQQTDTNDSCRQHIPLVSMNQSKQMSETQDVAEISCFSRRDKLDLRRSCGSVSYRFNSCGHELAHRHQLLGHGSRSTLMKPSHSLPHLPYSNYPMGSHRRLRHPSGSETHVSQKTSKLDLDSGHFCHKIPVDSDIQALYSQGKRKFDYPCLSERRIDPTSRNSVISKCSKKTRHITEGLVLACERNPTDLVRSMGKSRGKSPASRPCRLVHGLDIDKPVVESSDGICKFEGSSGSSDFGDLDQNEADEDDCTEALLGRREGSGNCVDEKSSNTHRATTMWKTTSPCRAVSVGEDLCSSLERGTLNQALLKERAGARGQTIFRGEGRCSSYKHLNESYCTGSYKRVRDYVKYLAKGRVSSECLQNEKTGNNARRLAHQEAVEEYFENTSEDNTELNDLQLKVKNQREATHGDLGHFLLFGQSADYSQNCIQSDADDSLEENYGINTVGISTEVLGKQNFEKLLNQNSVARNMHSKQNNLIIRSSKGGSLTDHQRTVNYSTNSFSRPGFIDRVDDASDVTNDRRVCLRSKSYDTVARQPRSEIAYAIQHSTEQPFISLGGAVPQSLLKNIEMDATQNNIDGAIKGSGSKFYKEGKSIECEIGQPLMNSSNHESRPRHLTEDTVKVGHVSESLVENNGSSSFRMTSLFNSPFSVQEYVTTLTLSDSHVNGRDMELSQSSSPVVIEGNKKKEPLFPVPRSETTSLARDPTRDDTKRELTTRRDLNITPRDRDFNTLHRVSTAKLMNTEQLYANSTSKVVTGQIEWGREIGSSRTGIQTVDHMGWEITSPNSPHKDEVKAEKQGKKTMLNRCHKKPQGCLQPPPDVGRHDSATDKQTRRETEHAINSTVDYLLDTRDNRFKSRSYLDKGCVTQRICSCSQVLCPLPENNPCLTNSIITNKAFNPYPVADLISCLQCNACQSSVSEVNTIKDGADPSYFTSTNSHLENACPLPSESGFMDVRYDDFMIRNIFIPEFFTLFPHAHSSIYCLICWYNERAPLSLAHYNDIHVHSSCHFRCEGFLEHLVDRGIISRLIETSYTNVLQVLLEYPDFDEDTCRFSSKENQRCYVNKSDASRCHAKMAYHEECQCTSRAKTHVCRGERSEDEGQQGNKCLTFVSKYIFPGQSSCDICLVQTLQNSIYGYGDLQAGQDNQSDAGQSESYCNIIPFSNPIGLSNNNWTFIVNKHSTMSLLKSHVLPSISGHLQMHTTWSQPLLIYDVVNSWTRLTSPLLQKKCFILQLIDKNSNAGNRFNYIRSSKTFTVPKFHQCISEPPYYECVSDTKFHQCVNFLQFLFQRNQTYCTNELCKEKLQKSIFNGVQSKYSNMQNNVLSSFAYFDYCQAESHNFLKTFLFNAVCLRCLHITSSVQVKQSHHSDKDDVCKYPRAQSHHSGNDDVCKYVPTQSHHKLSKPMSTVANGNASQSRQVVSEASSVSDNGACADRRCHDVVYQRESLTPSTDSVDRTPTRPHDANCVHRRKIGFQSDGSPGKLRWDFPCVIDASSHEARCLDSGHLQPLKKCKSLGDLHLFDNRADGPVSDEVGGIFHGKLNITNSISQLSTSPSNVAKKCLSKEETGTGNGDFHDTLSGTQSPQLRFCPHKNVDLPVGTDKSSLPLSISSDQIRDGILINAESRRFAISSKVCLENGRSPESPKCLDAKRISMNSSNQSSDRVGTIENIEAENSAFSRKTSSSSLVPRDDDAEQRQHGSLLDGTSKSLVPACESEQASGSDIPLINVDNCESVCWLGGALAPLASHFNKFAKVINVSHSPPLSLTIQSKKTNTENALSTSVPPPRPSELGGPLCDLTTQVNATNAIHSTLLKCLPTYSVTPALKPKDVNQTNNETCAFFVKSVFDAFFTTSGMSSTSEPCLNTAREDEEVYEFPLFPLSSGHLDTPDFSKRKGNVYHLPEASRLSSGNRSPWKNSSRSSGISHSWYSLNDLDPTNKPTLLRNSRFMYLTAIRRQLNNIFSPRGIRQFFGISDSPTMKKTLPRDRLSTNHINVIITRCESLVMDKSEDELPPMRSRAVTLDPTCMDKGTRSSNDSVYFYNTNNGAGPRCETVTTPKPRASSLDTTHSSVSRSDDQSLHSRSQDTSFDRSRGCSLDLLSPASASLRTGSMCSGISSMSRLTECSAYTEHSRSDCEKITRRSAEREHNITRLLGVITMIFVISWSVSWAVILYNTLSLEPVADYSHVMLSLPRDMFLINHFCNIIVYTILSRSFRDKLSQCYSSVKMC